MELKYGGGEQTLPYKLSYDKITFCLIVLEKCFTHCWSILFLDYEFLIIFFNKWVNMVINVNEVIFFRISTSVCLGILILKFFLLIIPFIFIFNYRRQFISCLLFIDKSRNSQVNLIRNFNFNAPKLFKFYVFVLPMFM